MISAFITGVADGWYCGKSGLLLLPPTDILDRVYRAGAFFGMRVARLAGRP